KINGPGGRLEPGETPRQAAIREVQEELHITPRGVRAVGEMRFQFHDGFAIHGYVFRAGAYTGTPTETAEACPIWTPLARIPYSRMWADDRLWMPLMLARQSFSGHFLFEGDRLREHRIETPARLAFDLH
ncbi:MAG: NUDIX domain-containing protein, partial [Candidatus Marinimicrobia bacterium]|nr:NUDIX domain-containing protein [Candidatus Neomarinimicrobiota bacterium]